MFCRGRLPCLAYRIIDARDNGLHELANRLEKERYQWVACGRRDR